MFKSMPVIGSVHIYTLLYLVPKIRNNCRENKYFFVECLFKHGTCCVYFFFVQ